MENEARASIRPRSSLLKPSLSRKPSPPLLPWERRGRVPTAKVSPTSVERVEITHMCTQSGAHTPDYMCTITRPSCGHTHMHAHTVTNHAATGFLYPAPAPIPVVHTALLPLWSTVSSQYPQPLSGPRQELLVHTGTEQWKLADRQEISNSQLQADTGPGGMENAKVPKPGKALWGPL